MGDIRNTRKVLAKFAARDRCLSYVMLAGELGFEPPHHGTQAVASHLQALIKEACRAGEPCLSAIVVGKNDLPKRYDGGALKMKPERLRGFVASAKKAGFLVGDDDAGFLIAQQNQVFAWGKREPS